MTDAATPAPRRGELTPISRTATVLLVLIAGYLWYLALQAIALLPPPFERLFAKFEIAGGLPEPTVLLIEAARIVGGYWYLFVAAGLAAAGILIWRGMVRDHLLLALLIAAISFITAGVVWIGTFAAMWLPFITLIHSVGEG